MTDDHEQPVPERVRDAIEASEWPELSIREVMERTGLSKQQVITAGASMDRLEIDQAIGAVRLPEDDGGEFHDAPSRELRTEGGNGPNRPDWLSGSGKFSSLDTIKHSHVTIDANNETEVRIEYNDKTYRLVRADDGLELEEYDAE